MLFLLTRKDNCGYDENCGFVIRAKSEQEAREMANEIHSDEGAIWEDPDQTDCEVLQSRGKSEIILTDYRAG